MELELEKYYGIYTFFNSTKLICHFQIVYVFGICVCYHSVIKYVHKQTHRCLNVLSL